LSSGLATITTDPPPLPLTLNLMFCVYIYNRELIPQNHVSDDIEIYHFRSAVMEGYVTEFTQSFLERPRSAICRRCSLAHHSQIQKCSMKSATRRSCPPICPPFRSVGFTSRLNAYNRLRVTIQRVLSETVEVPIKMDSCPGCDLSPYHLVRMPQISYVLLCSMHPRDVHYVIAGKSDVQHLDSGRRLESIQVFRFHVNFVLFPIVSLRQFAPHGVKT